MSTVVTNNDYSMNNAPEAEANVGATRDDDFIHLNDQRIRVLPGASETAASFEFESEDHTLGNALRYMIMKNPQVELCGYSIPHPSEAKMNIRIQTYDGTTVYDVLEKGFDDLMSLCDIVTDKFTAEMDIFNAKQNAE